MSGFSIGGNSGSFSAHPTASPGMSFGSSSSSHFGSAPTPTYFQQRQPQQSAPMIRPNTPYSSLPPNAKHAIDGIHSLIMRHRQSMNLAKSMAPDLLARNTLTTRTEELTSAVRNLETPLQSILLPSAHASLEDSSQLYSAALQYMVWPLEALAVRRHVAPTPLTQRSTVIYNKHITDSSTHPQGITTIA